jgi:hypothetical protein
MFQGNIYPAPLQNAYWRREIRSLQNLAGVGSARAAANCNESDKIQGADLVMGSSLFIGVMYDSFFTMSSFLT